ncbi:uncharacterized protein KQ657_004909 [Scheffersomyces spartinae]|uniref:Uncharacterized protein n=1 Tax=Scheffersomyces spartinae TaxID=45513 RepID=A0A9P7VBA5_9ASCO|nr:uncharacterized protein KQ657_004909 [Scheffersomyces spartinae]KAG7194199.1 hypothetical protein KQ657_004909 [Scheffersomyces spartinae]
MSIMAKQDKRRKQVERQLIDMLNSRVNENRCGECGAAYPTWASYNLGVFLCGRCASVHRRVLVPGKYSRVKSLSLDDWSDEQLDHLGRLGNKRSRKRWNLKRVPFPHDDDDDGPIEIYMREKYIQGKYRDTPIDPAEYSDHYLNFADEASTTGSRSRLNSHFSHTSEGRNRSNTASKSVPKLTHRKLTTFENTQYQKKVQQVLSFGYTDRDSVLESLLLSEGDIDLALDILQEDQRINPNADEIAPSLPKRSAQSSLAPSQPTGAASVAAASSATSSDWWSSNGNSGAATAAAITANPQQPQIYQYTDPVTGQVTYIDSNGQEYLDPSNPQHQQMLVQQTNPQLMAQQTNKANIMLLYSQPTAFTTTMAVPVQDKGVSQQAPLQQPQQLQQQQFGVQSTGYFMGGQPGVAGSYGYQFQQGNPQQQQNGFQQGYWGQ